MAAAAAAMAASSSSNCSSLPELKKLRANELRDVLDIVPIEVLVVWIGCAVEKLWQERKTQSKRTVWREYSVLWLCLVARLIKSAVLN